MKHILVIFEGNGGRNQIQEIGVTGNISMLTYIEIRMKL